MWTGGTEARPQLGRLLVRRDHESERSCHLSSQSLSRPSPRLYLERRPPGGREPSFEHLGGSRAVERLVRPVLEVVGRVTYAYTPGQNIGQIASPSDR